MHHGALGATSETGPRSVLFDLPGAVLIAPETSVATEVGSLSPVVCTVSRAGGVLRPSRPSVPAACFHARLRGGSREIV